MAVFTSRSLNTGWEFRFDGDEEWRAVERVPSVLHLDLLAHKLIPDTSIDQNELAAHWVNEVGCSYRTEFDKPAGSAVALQFEGLDTIATVRLNGAVILTSDNMFVSHHVDITHLVRDVNSLLIDFAPAAEHGREVQRQHPEHRCLTSLGSAERVAVRKAQYHWGWDWGPTYTTAGPWRPVNLLTYTARLRDVSVRYVLADDLKSCQVTVTAEVECPSEGSVNFTLRPPSGSVKHQKCSIGNGVAEAQFTLDQVHLWNPYGHGEQHRYQLDAELIVSEAVVHSQTKKIGLRKAELVQEKDEFGKSFYFRVNNVDIFAGGACWIPADTFIPRLTTQDYRDWLALMVESNQIMIRIWGGGIYEEDVFYDTCDELGILVWQDFMFACGSYPAFPEFLASVETEARQNVRRLRDHPSVVVYAGGNENYYIQELFALEYNYDDKDHGSWLRSSFPSRYIYEHLLPKVVSDESPNTPFHPDSPWGDGRRILDATVGDIHQWEIWHGIMRPYQEYGSVSGRFNSEFGMQAFPHLDTVTRYVTDESERHPQSLTMDFHNKCKTHERRLATYVRDNFDASDSTLANWIYLTQLAQSEAMDFAYRAWRRHWGKPGARACGGALVWQLNDCWPVTSWALVDFYRVRKPALYTVKRALSPVCVSVLRTYDDWTVGHPAVSTSHSYDVWVSCDASEFAREVCGKRVEVEMRFVSIATGEDALPSRKITVSKLLHNGTTTICERESIPNHRGPRAFVIAAELLVDGEVLSSDVDWPQPLKYISFPDRGVSLTQTADTVEVTAQRPTKGLVFEERQGVTLSDNCLDLMPGRTYTVKVDGVHGELKYAYLGMR